MTFLLIKKINKIKIIYNERIVFLFFTCLSYNINSSYIFNNREKSNNVDDTILSFFGTLFMELIKKNINFKYLKIFPYLLFFFFISPSIYLTDSLLNNYKRTDYPEKKYEHANKWDDNFTNEIKIVVGRMIWVTYLSFAVKT